MKCNKRCNKTELESDIRSRQGHECRAPEYQSYNAAHFDACCAANVAPLGNNTTMPQFMTANGVLVLYQVFLRQISFKTG